MPAMDSFGVWAQKAGTTGTVTLEKGSSLLQIIVHSTSGGTLTIFGGPSFPVLAGASSPVSIRFDHLMAGAFNNAVIAGSQDVVFTGCDQYYIEYVKPKGATV